MSMADLDGDGDLGVGVHNPRGPARLFDNQLCGGQALEVDLLWLASRITRAIGARLVRHTSAGTFYRDVRVAILNPNSANACCIGVSVLA